MLNYCDGIAGRKIITMVEKQDSSRITKGKIDEAITALKDIKPKERSTVSDREAIQKMRRYIEKLTSDKYGYTCDEVSEMLKGLGINLTGSRIKYLMGELKKSSRRQKKTLENENSGELESAASADKNSPPNKTKSQKKTSSKYSQKTNQESQLLNQQ